MICSTRYFSLATWQISMLSSSSPVTAITMSALELLLHRQVAVPLVLDQGDLVALVEQLPRQVPSDLAGPDDDDVLALTLSHRPPHRCPKPLRPPDGPAPRASRSPPWSGRPSPPPDPRTTWRGADRGSG